jgi:predicted transposase/invertase (TIGR01784 family)
VQTDSLFYRLFQTAPEIFFDLIATAQKSSLDGRSLEQAYIFRSVELKQTAFRIDGVFLPIQENADATVYFVEVQFHKDEQLYRRLFAEIFLFLRQNLTIHDWRAVIIYPERSIEPSDVRPYQNYLALPEICRIYLDELEDEPSSIGVSLIKLMIEPESTAIGRAKQLLNQSQQLEGAALSQQEIVELIETIVVYKFPQLSRQEIEQMLELSDLKQTRVYQEALAEGRSEGLEQGLEEGKRQEGLSLILRLLNRKLGSLPPDMRSRVEQLSISQLEMLAEALLDFSDMTDLENWLQSS